MNKFTSYIKRQADRRPMDLAHDFFVMGGFMTCIYFGFIH